MSEKETSAPGPRRKSGGLSIVALRNAGFAAVTRASSLIVGLLLTPIVLGGLGREVYGLAQVVSSVYEYISLLRGGITTALRRYVTLHHHRGNRLETAAYFAVGFWWSGILRTVILLLGWAIAGPICRFLRVPPDMLPESTLGVALIIAATVIADAGAIFEIPIFATGRTESLSVLRALASWMRLGITAIAFRLFEPSLPLYGVILILVETIPLIVLIPLAQRRGVVGPVFPRWTVGEAGVRKELFSYGRLALVGHVAALLYTATDNVLIGRIYGAAAVTAYSLGARWASLIRGFLRASLTSLVPLLTELEAKGESERSRRAVVEAVRLTSIVAVPCCLVPCVIGDIFLVHWVGEEYRSSYRYLLAMVAPLTLDIALMPVWMAMTARGRIGWITTGDLIVAVSNVVLSLFLALGLKMGLLGFALGNTVAMLAKQLVLRPIAGRRDPTFPSAREYLAPLPRAVAGGTLGLLLLYWMRPWCAQGVLAMLACAAASTALTLAGAAYVTLGVAGIKEVLRRFGTRRSPAERES